MHSDAGPDLLQSTEQGPAVFLTEGTLPLPSGNPAAPARQIISQINALATRGRTLHRRSPGGKALFQMMGVFAEFERSIIQDRIHAGLARARAQGKRLGRPSIPVTIERKIRDALKKGGTGIRKLAAKHHVGVGTVQRIKRELDR